MAVEMIQYRSKDGDVLDDICYRHYASSDVIVSILDANPHLADLGAVLAGGVIIKLPVLTVPAQASQPVQLWD